MTLCVTAGGLGLGGRSNIHACNVEPQMSLRQVVTIVIIVVQVLDNVMTIVGWVLFCDIFCAVGVENASVDALGVFSTTTDQPSKTGMI